LIGLYADICSPTFVEEITSDIALPDIFDSDVDPHGFLPDPTIRPIFEGPALLHTITDAELPEAQDRPSIPDILDPASPVEAVLECRGNIGHLPFSTILFVLSFFLSALTNLVDDDAGQTKRKSISASYPTAAKTERGKK
jgi:hypothetical protein